LCLLLKSRERVFDASGICLLLPRRESFSFTPCSDAQCGCEWLPVALTPCPNSSQKLLVAGRSSRDMPPALRPRSSIALEAIHLGVHMEHIVHEITAGSDLKLRGNQSAWHSGGGLNQSVKLPPTVSERPVWRRNKMVHAKAVIVVV
jgi:hypothetical protein